MIKIRNLNKYYNKNKSNEIHVIDNTNLELPSKGLISFLGASGSGKTTLLNVIGGLDKALGEITYDNLTFTNYKVRKIDDYRMKNIGYIFQNYNLLPNLTVYQNIKLSLNLIGITDEVEIEKRIEYCLNSVKMLKFKKRKAIALSGGQQQRVSIARALAKNSKIIIADEPTGNLDSQNSIEVMNILRKISQTKLVLLVTHNKDLASFYSDKIVELKDGKITSYHDNDLLFQSLEGQKSNDVYLKDLKENKLENEFTNLTIYQENEVKEKLDLVIVFKNNNIYLKTNKSNIKIIDVNTDIKLINDSFKKIDEQQVLNFEFDTTDFNEIPKKKYIDLKSIIINFKIAILNFFDVKRRGKVLYLCLILIGFLLSNAVNTYSQATKVDFTYAAYEENAYIAYNDEEGYINYQKLFEAYEEACNLGLITSHSIYSMNFDLNLDFLPLSDPYNMLGKVVQVYYCDISEVEDSSMLFGSNKITSNQIVLSKTTADRLIENASPYIKLDYQSLIGLEALEFKIAGVADIEGNTVYISNFNPYYKTNTWLLDNGMFDYEVVFKKELATFDNEVLVNVKLADVYRIGSTVLNGYSNPYTVVGYFTSDDVDVDFICDFLVTYGFNSSFLELNKIDYELTEGKNPTSIYEVLVPYTSNLNIGEELLVNSSRMTVVGKYFSKSAEDAVLGDVYLTILSLLGYKSGFDFLIFTNNPTELQRVFNDYGYNFMLSKDYYINKHKESYRTSNLALFTTAITLFTIVIVYIFFMMRTKMINKIYDIGVYRALGAKKSKLVGKFMYDLIVITTLTSLLGYLMGSSFYYLASRVPFLGDYIVININYSLLGILLIYILNIFFGLLPIVLLLRKTPSEIIAKYDI